MSQAEQETTVELKDIFKKFAVNQERRRTPWKLEDVAFRHAEVLDYVSSYSAWKIPVNCMLGPARLATRRWTTYSFSSPSRTACRDIVLYQLELGPTLSHSISFGEPSPYLSSQVCFWEGMVLVARRFDAAEWRKRISPTSDASLASKLIKKIKTHLPVSLTPVYES